MEVSRGKNERRIVFMNYKIRIGNLNDIKKIREIYKPYVEETAITFEYVLPDENEFSKRMNHIQKQFPWLVLEYDKEVVAYAYASTFGERAAYQWDVELSIYVSKEFHGRKIGSILYRTLIDVMFAQGYYNLYGRLVYPNKYSEKLHTSLGFKKTALLKNVGNKFGNWYDVLYMKKQLREYKNNPIRPIPFPLLDKNVLDEILKKNTIF